MKNRPATSDIVSLLRNADEQTILKRLDEIDGERDALKTLLRSVRARRRAPRSGANDEETRHG